MKPLTLLLLFTIVATAFSDCSDKPNYYDSDGDGCPYYTKNPSACQYAANNRQGVSPRDACCACGGGIGSTQATTTTSVSAKCSDKVNFYDADGDGCSYYTRNPSACYNARANRQGVSPRQACCACGGGTPGLLQEQYLDATTVFATGCTDKSGFYDADGDGCSYYTKNPGACANARANRQGVSPKQACCACGGGNGATATTTGSNGRCVDYANYVDADGGSCAQYNKYPNFCTNSAIARPNSQGISPNQACCVCGGGARYFLEEGYLDAATVLADGCTDKPAYYDADGDGCSYYTKNPGACANARANRQGVSPSQACCACGGGSGAAGTTTMTTTTSTRCNDKTNYYDADGDGCSYYTKNPSACANGRANKQGVSPRQACCACGGGNPYLQQEFDATVFATGCTDKTNFYDADGDGCSYYNKNPGACTNARANRQGVTPKQACCACGGGSGATGSTTTTTTTSGSNARCVDYANYVDADGGSCASYTKYPNFCANSAIARPNREGISPNQACCACGGGARYLMNE